MSFMQSAWGRALGGAGLAAAGIANKYIDEEIQNNRAQLLADIAHNSRVKTDQYELSDERQAQVRRNAAAATMAKGEAERASATAGVNDENYQGALDADAKRGATRKIDAAKQELQEMTPAKIEAEKKVLAELTPAKVAAEKAIIEGTMGAKAKQAGLMARASDLDGANRASRNELLQLELKDRKRLGELYDEYLAVVNDEAMPDTAKQKKLAPITNAIGAIKMKSAPAGAGRNPEFDTEKVIEEKTNPDGTTTKVERVQKRLPGNMPARDEVTDPIKAAMDAARKAREGK